MRLSDATYEETKQSVADMLVTYNIKGTPINAFEVAIKMGLSVIPYSALNTETRLKALKYSSDGFSIETLHNEWIIYYNDESKSYERINQTIMHEIGHFFLGHEKEGEEEESEAKFFAKYALVSPPLIHNMTIEKTINNIMTVFAISYQTATIAFHNYQKRFRYGPKNYTNYEQQILTQITK